MLARKPKPDGTAHTAAIGAAAGAGAAIGAVADRIGAVADRVESKWKVWRELGASGLVCVLLWRGADTLVGQLQDQAREAREDRTRSQQMLDRAEDRHRDDLRGVAQVAQSQHDALLGKIDGLVSETRAGRLAMERTEAEIVRTLRAVKPAPKDRDAEPDTPQSHVAPRPRMVN